MLLVLSALIFHGLLGGIDVVLNHELSERLPQRLSAWQEQALHSAREALFALLFLGLAWFQWHGAWAWVIVALIAAELAVTLRDSVVEDRTRQLPVFERLLHAVLFINLGVYATLLAPHLWAWLHEPAALVSTNYGWPSYVLTLLGLLAVGWCLRDAVSYRRLRQVAA